MIDFTLSNCVNSGLRRIYVLAQYAATSLIRHLRRGWVPLLSDPLGEYIEVLPPQRVAGDRWYAGTADAIYQNLRTLQEDRPELVLLVSGDHAYKMDYRPMIAHHLEKNAELTIGAVAVPRERGRHLGVMTVDGSGRVIEFHEKPAEPKPIPDRTDEALCNMGVYVWNTRCLVEQVIKDAKQSSSHDFGKDILPAMVAEGKKVYAHEFTDLASGSAGYWRDIGTIESYWDSHMDLVGVSPQLDLYDSGWPLYTARSHYPPAKAVLGSKTELSDVLMSEGCVISGAKVVRSVLSPGVKILEGAEVVECILLDRVVVGRRARLHRAIIDEDLTVPEGYQIGIRREEDEKRFVVSETGITVVPSGAVFT
jgi:glucose-1-phosphate adenylyltransferase